MPRIDSRFFRDAWRLSKPFWTSEERWGAIGLLVGIVALNLFQVYLLVLLNEWRGLFFDAVQAYDKAVVFHQLLRFCMLAAIFIAGALTAFYCNQLLQIRWRRWMTGRLLSEWLGDHVYYRMQIEGTDTDNPDQRIAEDLRLFPQLVLSLSVGLLSAVVTFISFISILWALSGPLTVPIGSWGTVTIPGYAAVGAIVYAALGTWATVKIGRPLVGLTFNQQRFEADFRYSLVRVRENAESIAFYHGEPRENQTLSLRFGNVYRNFIALLIRQMKLNVVNLSYTQAAVIFPIMVALPKYFEKTIQFGGLMQILTAFDQVQTSLSYIVNSYSDIAGLSAVMARLRQFEERSLAIKGSSSPIQLSRAPNVGLEVQDLTLDLPDGSTLRENVALGATPGERVLITGPTGTGKSTLLRAISGLWPFGRGRIISSGERPLFLSQRPYLPLGTLRDAVTYPAESAAIPTESVAAALREVGLEKFVAEMDKEDNWAQRLSIGEQQRVAFARIFVYRPDMIFLDEATSALDEESEHMLYKRVESLTPRPTIISVGHRSTLKPLHDSIVHLGSARRPEVAV